MTAASLLLGGSFVFFSPRIYSTISITNQTAQVGGSLLSGLVVHYTFNEGTGVTASDASGSGNTATLTNSPTWTTVGKNGGAISLDGVDDWISAGSSSSLDDLPQFSISFWANSATYGEANSGVFMEKGGSLNSGWSFSQSASNGVVNFKVEYGTTDLQVVSVNQTLPASELNTWIYWTVTWDGTASASGVRIYKNGTEVAYKAQVDGVGPRASDAVRNLVVGNNATTIWSFQGLMDEVRVYNRPLSSAEVLQLYSGDVEEEVTTAPTASSTPPMEPLENPPIVQPPIPANNSSLYWVSPTGTAAWADCRGDADPGIYCSLATANANARAGNTVYLKGGIYQFSTQYIFALAPVYSGTVGNPIIFKNAPAEIPEIKGTYGTRMWGFVLQGVGYVVLDGIIFSDFSDTGMVRGSSHHIEIKNSTFRNVTSPYRGGGVSLVEACVGGSQNNCPVSNIWVHHNTFYKLAAGGGCVSGRISEGGDALRIGYPSNVSPRPTGNNSYITIEDNYMAYAGHAVMDSYGQNTVIKNNVAHNEPWYPADNGTCAVNFQPLYSNPSYDGLYGHRVWQITDTFQRDGTFNLIEGNRLGYGSVNPNNNGAESMAIASSKNILRYNSFYGSMNYGIMPKYGPTGWQSIGGLNNKIYQNTIYKHGFGYPFFQTCTTAQSAVCPAPLYGINFYYPTLNTGNTIKNNIVYANYYASIQKFSDIAPSTGNIVESNWLTTQGDPQFQNPDLTQTTSKTLPDFHLRSGSPAINNGTYLTKAVNTGNNSRTIIVQDASYFQDGTWGADLARGATQFPDKIAIGSVNNIVEIERVDYSTNTITLRSSISWLADAPVWLHSNSSGQRVLYGSAPDTGAYEYPLPDQAIIDVTAPIISSASATSITTAGVVISWTTNEPATTQVQYGLTTAYGSQTTLNSNLSTSHIQQLTNLQPNTLYHYRLISKDAAGNTTISSDGTFSTLALNAVTQTPIVNNPPVNSIAPTNSVAQPVSLPNVAGTCTPTFASSTLPVLPSFTPALRFGSRGTNVSALQRFLADRSYLARTYITGYYGPLTTAAVTKYNKDRLTSVPVKTCPTTTTSTATLPLPSRSASEGWTRNLKVGMTGADVKALQQYLNAKGFQVSLTGPGSPGNETTYYGPATARAVTRFQEAYRAEVLTPNNLTRGTGYFGPATRAKVNEGR